MMVWDQITRALEMFESVQTIRKKSLHFFGGGDEVCFRVSKHGMRLCFVHRGYM